MIKTTTTKTTMIKLTTTKLTTSKYIIAIPSYKRSTLIQSKTLKTLHRHGIQASKINIFVANDDEYKIYKTAIPKQLYNNLIIGEIGLKNQRNFISNYYPVGTHIVELDDDIDDIIQLHTRTKQPKQLLTQKQLQSVSSPLGKSANYTTPINNLDLFIKKAFKLCSAKQAYLWGVYPVSNPYFMTDTVTTDLRFIVGPMWGIINRHSDDLILTMDEKENTQRTLQYYVKDSTVIRFNNISIITKYYKTPGGMQETNGNRSISAMKSAQLLHAQYPTLTTVWRRRKTGFPEVKLLKTGKCGKV